MEIKIGTPLSLNKRGVRQRQEDSIMPTTDKIKENENCFVLCDGMGGHEHGEVAASVVTDSLYSNLSDSEEPLNPNTLSTAVDKAYDALDRFAQQEKFRNMGTTMACLYMSDLGYLAAHIGDSRIYHIRPALYDENNPKDCILYRSWDHSLVNMMVKMGEITEEEAKTHPNKNVLIKAMQPNMGDNRSRPFIHTSDDIKKGDYFFICSDGVNGYVEDEILMHIITDKNMPDSRKIKEIDELCRERSRDNYSCWLIPIANVISL